MSITIEQGIMQEKLAIIPNLLSCVRLFLSPLIFWLLISNHTKYALLFFLIAAASDWLDGRIARAFSWQSRLGTLLDPIADKSLVFFTSLALCLLGVLPKWLFILMIARDVVILLGGAAILLNQWYISLAPTRLSKANTGAQLYLIIDYLLRPFFPAFTGDFFFKDEMVYTVALLTLASGGEYVFRFFQQFPRRDLNYD